MKYWLSFADSNKPKGQTFLGVCMVEVKDYTDPKEGSMAAVRKSHILGINPGGEVQILQLPADFEIHESWMDTLLDKRTIKAHDTIEGWKSPKPEDTDCGICGFAGHVAEDCKHPSP